MSVRILVGDVLAMLATLEADSVDCVVTSPPYWGLRDYGVEGQIGLEPTLGEHLDVMLEVFRAVRRVLKPTGTLWINYGDCYATKPAGWSAARYKAESSDDRTFRDKPFSTVGPIYDPSYARARGNFVSGGRQSHVDHGGRVVAGGLLKPKDLCMVPNRLAIALQEDGWWVRSEIIWGKPNGMPDSSGKYRPSTSHEKIFLLSKTGSCYYDADAVKQPVSEATNLRIAQNVADQIGSARANGGARANGNMKAVVGSPKTLAAAPGSKNNPSFVESTVLKVDSRYLRNYEPPPFQVWHMPVKGFKEAHFATFPPELPTRCILAGCPEGGVVLDPFGGAGTTGLVADQLQRDAILIELNPEYAELAERRIHGASPLLAKVSA